MDQWFEYGLIQSTRTWLGTGAEPQLLEVVGPIALRRKKKPGLKGPGWES
jgi:hypothetical protein